MNGLIDYAGLFPPASHDLETAVNNHQRNLGGQYGWMAGRFILPLSQLQSLSQPPPFVLSVIVAPGLQPEMVKLLATCKRQVDMLEMPVAGDDEADTVSALLESMQTVLSRAGLQNIMLFLEVGENEGVVSHIARMRLKQQLIGQVKGIGVKVRCGGVDKRAFPPPEQVAETIMLCRDHDLPIKFTAGLHNPLRSYEERIDVMQYGFFNVLGAALFAYHCNLALGEIVSCLIDEDPNHFIFSEEHFSWKENSIAAVDIQRIRNDKVISFGSCSFYEPIEGLSALGLLGNKGQ